MLVRYLVAIFFMMAMLPSFAGVSGTATPPGYEDQKKKSVQTENDKKEEKSAQAESVTDD